EHLLLRARDVEGAVLLAGELPAVGSLSGGHGSLLGPAQYASRPERARGVPGPASPPLVGTERCPVGSGARRSVRHPRLDGEGDRRWTSEARLRSWPAHLPRKRPALLPRPQTR